MGQHAGVLVYLDDQLLLVRERWEQVDAERWNPPSGRIEDGERPPVAAAREVKEESGCVVDADRPELIATSSVVRDGVEVTRSWNYTTTTEDHHLGPDDPDGTVLGARWFPRSTAVGHVAALTYPPIREPLVAYLNSGIVAGTGPSSSPSVRTPGPTSLGWHPPARADHIGAGSLGTWQNVRSSPGRHGVRQIP